MEIPPVYSCFKIIPKADEEKDNLFPRNIGEAIMLFNRTGKKSYEENCRNCMTNLLDILARGPDGKTQISIASYACICWDCGNVHIPLNSSLIENSKEDEHLKGICPNCNSENHTNLVKGVQVDGSMIPWIEVILQTVS